MNQREIGNVAGIALLILVQYVASRVGAPWYATLIAILALLPVATFVLYLTSTTTAVSSFTPLKDIAGDSALTVLRNQVDGPIYRLRDTGLQPVGPWFTDSDDTFYALLQNPESSDIAVIQTTAHAQQLQFLRRRSDGSWLETSCGGDNWPPAAGDDVFYVPGVADPLKVWRAHQVRVARDRRSGRNPTVTDPLAFQVDCEQRDTQNLVARGYKTRTSNGKLRATVTGAFVLLREHLSPWTLLDQLRRRKAFAELLKAQELTPHGPIP